MSLYNKIIAVYGALRNAIAGKQDALTFDATPTAGSTNPATSGGIRSEIETLIGNLDVAIETIRNTILTEIANNYLKSKATSMTSPGVVTDWLASESVGGVRIRASSTSTSNYTSYAYGGVAVRRNNVTNDFLWGNNSANNGIVRFKDIPYYKNPASILNRSAKLHVVYEPGDGYLQVMPAAEAGKIRDFIVDVHNVAGAARTIDFAGLGETYIVVVDNGENLSAMTTLAAGEMARFHFSETAFTEDNLPVFHVVKHVVKYPGSAQGEYSLNTDGTVSTEGELNSDGTFTVEGELNSDGTFTVEAI